MSIDDEYRIVVRNGATTTKSRARASSPQGTRARGDPGQSAGVQGLSGWGSFASFV
jgi:hypothetical protein